jgi:hypothetical protein
VTVGTRGFIAFAVDGTEKVAYNHAGSHPEDLGLTVLRWLRDGALNYAATAEARARSLRLVDPTARPSAGDTGRLWRYAWTQDGRPAETWHALLRRTEGNPRLMLEAGVITDDSEWPYHPQARWGYVIDFDARRLEAYQGGQREAHSRGRFARRGAVRISGTDFWPAALVAAWPFSALPSDDRFEAACYAEEGS